MPENKIDIILKLLDREEEISYNAVELKERKTRKNLLERIVSLFRR